MSLLKQWRQEMFANSFRIEMSMKEIWPSEIYRCIKEGNAVEELGHFVNLIEMSMKKI